MEDTKTAVVMMPRESPGSFCKETVSRLFSCPALPILPSSLDLPTLIHAWTSVRALANARVHEESSLAGRPRTLIFFFSSFWGIFRATDSLYLLLCVDTFPHGTYLRLYEYACLSYLILCIDVYAKNCLSFFFLSFSFFSGSVCVRGGNFV